MSCCCLVIQLYLFATPWSVANQVPLSLGFPEYWSGLPFPSPGDLPNPGIEPMSPTLAGGFFWQWLSYQGSPIINDRNHQRRCAQSLSIRPSWWTLCKHIQLLFAWKTLYLLFNFEGQLWCVEYSWLAFFSFSTLNILFYFLLAYKSFQILLKKICWISYWGFLLLSMWFLSHCF